MEAQGYPVKCIIVYQDNKSTILLERNGKRSSSQRTRHFNIRYFFLTDQIEKGTVEVQYCPTGSMLADYMTKPLQGSLFEAHKKALMGSPPNQNWFVCAGVCWTFSLNIKSQDLFWVPNVMVLDLWQPEHYLG